MAYRTLKEEIETLKQTFTAKHERFQILAATHDELNCRFIGRDGEQYDITANIAVNYPSTPPVWFAESDEVSIMEAIQIISNNFDCDNHIINQIDLLLRELCRLHTVSLPSELENLRLPLQSNPCAHSSNHTSKKDFDIDGLDNLRIGCDHEEEEEEEEKDEEEEVEDEEDLPFKINDDPQYSCKEVDIGEEHSATLERLRKIHWQDYINGSVSSSPQATSRLIKEMGNIYRSNSFKDNLISIEFVNDSLYSWKVRLSIVESDSTLYNALVEKGGNNSILLSITFNTNYPFEPPIVRVEDPVITESVIDPTGAICMDFLTIKGWSSAITMEALILQILVELVVNGGKVDRNASYKNRRKQDMGRSELAPPNDDEI